MDHFWAKVDIRGPDECWEWLGACFPSGYGMLTVKGKKWYAHRRAWFLKNGPIPEGISILHRCDNRPCCNDLHLFSGTQAENISDMWSKGRGYRGGPGASAQRGEQSPHAKLTQLQVDEIRLRRASGETGRALAKEFGVNPATICNLWKRKSWR